MVAQNNKRVSCLFGSLLVAMMVNVPLDGAPSVEVAECCSKTFALDEVIAFARGIERIKLNELFEMVVVPQGKKNAFSIAGSSEESSATCHDHAVRLRNSLDHAFLFKTHLGYAVHHWNHAKKEYRRVTLFGQDIYDLKFEQGARLALATQILDGKGGFKPYLKIVVHSILDTAYCLRVTREIMSALGVSSATSLLREDGDTWSGSCFPYSLPIQWRREPIGDPPGMRSESVLCRVGADGLKSECMILQQLGER